MSSEFALPAAPAAVAAPPLAATGEPGALVVLYGAAERKSRMDALAKHTFADVMIEDADGGTDLLKELEEKHRRALHATVDEGEAAVAYLDSVQDQVKILLPLEEKNKTLYNLLRQKIRTSYTLAFGTAVPRPHGTSLSEHSATCRAWVSMKTAALNEALKRSYGRRVFTATCDAIALPVCRSPRSPVAGDNGCPTFTRQRGGSRGQGGPSTQAPGGCRGTR